MKVTIVYWSGTGNTEIMSENIEIGASAAGADVERKPVSSAGEGDVDACDVLALGCPSMGEEILEEDEFEPFFSKIEGRLSGKKVALFGSYDWGDGQWMRDWVERAKKAGAEVVTEGLTVNLTPEGDDIQRCKDFGVSLGKA